MLKNLTCCVLTLLASQASGQAHPPLGLRVRPMPAMLPGTATSPSKLTVEPVRLPGTRSRFETGYALASPPSSIPTASIAVLPNNRLAYYRLSSPVSTVVGAVAGWLLDFNPRVQAYQQSRQFTGRDNVLPVPRQARPDDQSR